MGIKIGYARVSTRDQNLDLQLDALRKAGVDDKYIFSDKKSGRVSEREGLAKALSHLREGDTLVVYKLDRLGRTVKQLVELVDSLHNQGVGFASLTERIDTSTAQGKFFFFVMSAMSQMERELIAERTRAGLNAARARGKPAGAPVKFTEEKIKSAVALLNSGVQPKVVAAQMGVSVSTLYRKLPGARPPKIETQTTTKTKGRKEKEKK